MTDTCRDKAELIQHIRQAPWFQGLSESSYDALLSCAKRKHYPAKAYITQGTDIFCLLSGTLQLSLNSPHGESWIIGNCRSPYWLGESSLSSAPPQPIEMLVTKEAELLVFPATQVKSIAREEPVIYENLFNDGREQFNLILQSFEMAAFYPLPARLAMVLLAMIDWEGEETDRGIRLTSAVDQGSIAKQCLGSRPRVSELLKEWVDQGILINDNKHYIIADKAALETKAIV